MSEKNKLKTDRSTESAKPGQLLGVDTDKATEDSTLENEQLYHAVFEHSPIGISVRRANGQLLSVNRAWKSIWNISSEQLEDYLTSKPAKFNFDKRDDYLDHWQPQVARIYQKGGLLHIPKLQLRGHRHDSPHWVSQTFYAIVDSAGVVDKVVILTDDITDRVKTENALKESEEKYRHVVENISHATWKANQAKTSSYISPNIFKLIGYTDHEVMDSHFEIIFDHIHPDDRSETDRFYSTHFPGEGPFEIEYRIQHRDGHWIWLHDITRRAVSGDGEIWTYGIASDITHRKETEMELRQFKTLADSATYGLCVTDLSGKFRYVNPCFAEMHGYSQSELVDQYFSIFHTEEQLIAMRKYTQNLLQHGHFTSIELWHKHKDNSVFPTLMNSVVIKGKDDKQKYIASTATDISEIKQLQDFAERAERLETAGRIAGQVAHDFNNLLSPLVAYPSIISDELGADHPVMQYIQTMAEAAGQMAEINEQLLTLGRRGHYNRVPLNLNEVIKSVLPQFSHLPATTVIDTDLAEDLMNISGGRAQISRLIANLIANALDAVLDMGQIRIATENCYIDADLIGYEKIPLGEYVKMTIIDTGCGIPAELLSRIFDPFVTTKTTDKQRGSGLGLSVVSAVAQDQNAYIDIHSEVGTGSSFFIYFPITRELPEIELVEELCGGTESILVVDDDSVQNEVSDLLLTKLGYQVVTVSSGEKAVKLMRTESFDLLLFDMIMPGGIDGTETYRQVLEINPGQKAIVLSGFAESSRVQQAIEMGATEFLRKPLTINSMAAAVRRTLDTHTTQPVETD